MKNNKLLIILISVFLALVIGITTVLLVVVNTSSAGSSDNTQTENNNSDTNTKDFTIEVNNVVYNSGSTNNIDLIVGQKYDFNITGVKDYNDYECKIIGFLPSPNYHLIYSATRRAFLNAGLVKYETDISEDLLNAKAYLDFKNDDFTNGFSLLKSNNKFSFLMEYYSMESFLSNFLQEDVECISLDEGPDGEYDDILEDFLVIHTFKLEVRKISTDELISFVLYFKE